MEKREYMKRAKYNYDDCITIMEVKSSDYAQVTDPFANFRTVEAFPALGVTLEQGILVRVLDKFSRISNLLVREGQVKDEAIEDTIRDAMNYLNVILISLQDKKKEECKCQLNKSLKE